MKFSTTDPLGRLVILKASTWNKHIITGHTDMYKQEKLVQKVIEDPKFILPDKSNSSRESYIDLCNIRQLGCLTVIKVVVDHSTGTGDIVTAYTTTTGTQVDTKRGVIYERT